MINQLPKHLFAADDGALYDTRRPEWHKLPPLRPVYRRHFSEIATTAEFKASLRAGGYTFPGGYSLAFTTVDGCILCFSCARKDARLILDSIRHRHRHRDGWQINGLINADEHDGTTWCDHCNTFITGPDEDEELQP